MRNRVFGDQPSHAERDFSRQRRAAPHGRLGVGKRQRASVLYIGGCAGEVHPLTDLTVIRGRSNGPEFLAAGGREIVGRK